MTNSSKRTYRDLREHIDTLDQKGLLLTIDEPIDKDSEMHPLVRWQFRGGIDEADRKAFLFTNIVNGKGRRYDMSVAVCALAAFISEHGARGAKLYREFGDDLEQARAAFEDYAGEYRSAADFAEEVTRDSGTEIPASLDYYIDWQALARDMAMNGEIMVFQTGFDEVHIFWSR